MAILLQAFLLALLLNSYLSIFLFNVTQSGEAVTKTYQMRHYLLNNCM